MSRGRDSESDFFPIFSDYSCICLDQHGAMHSVQQSSVTFWHAAIIPRALLCFLTQGTQCSHTPLLSCPLLQGNQILFSEKILFKSQYLARWRWCTPLIPALRRQGQVDLCEFEASLVYRVTRAMSVWKYVSLMYIHTHMHLCWTEYVPLK